MRRESAARSLAASVENDQANDLLRRPQHAASHTLLQTPPTCNRPSRPCAAMITSLLTLPDAPDNPNDRPDRCPAGKQWAPPSHPTLARRGRSRPHPHRSTRRNIVDAIISTNDSSRASLHAWAADIGSPTTRWLN